MALTRFQDVRSEEVGYGAKTFAFRVPDQHATGYALAGQNPEAHPQPVATYRPAAGLLWPRGRTGLLKGGTLAPWGRYQ